MGYKRHKQILEPAIGTADGVVVKVGIGHLKDFTVDVVNISATLGVTFAIKTAVIDNSLAHVNVTNTFVGAASSTGNIFRRLIQNNHAEHLIIQMSASLTYTGAPVLVVVSSIIND